jgi:hypothetical protein
VVNAKRRHRLLTTAAAAFLHIGAALNEGLATKRGDISHVIGAARLARLAVAWA